MAARKERNWPEATKAARAANHSNDSTSKRRGTWLAGIPDRDLRACEREEAERSSLASDHETKKRGGVPSHAAMATGDTKGAASTQEQGMRSMEATR